MKYVILIAGCGAVLAAAQSPAAPRPGHAIDRTSRRASSTAAV